MSDSDDHAGGAGRMREYDMGTVLYREGDEGDTLYIVQSGMVALRRQRGKHEELEQVERGEFFGELSVINASPRDATATVVEASKLLEIDSPTFERMLQANAEIAVRIIRKMATRIDRLSRRPSSAEVRMALKAAAEEQDTDSSDTAAPAAAPIQPAASWPPAPSQPTGPMPAWGHTGQFQQPDQFQQSDPYADMIQDPHENRGSAAKSVFVFLIIVAGLVGLIAAIVLMNTGIDN